VSKEIFLMPDVGEGLVEAEIVTWKVNVGDVVTLNQPLVDIETAKATVELPSPFAGVIVTLHGNEGDVIEVHQPLVTIDSSSESTSSSTKSDDVKVLEVLIEPSSSEPREAVLVGYGVANEDAITKRTHRRGSPRAAAPLDSDANSSSTSALAPRSTPPVRLYAKQNGIDMSALVGSGRDGLITRGDVERALHETSNSHGARASRMSAGPTTTSRFVGKEIASWSTGEKEERIPVKGVLRSMSDAMVQSAFSAPHAAVWVRVDATRTVELLEGLKKHPNLADVRLSPLVVVALAFCDAARHYPGINSSFDEANAQVIVRRSVNLGIAADTPRGLIVPNIKGADELDLVNMAIALNTLVQKARAGTTTPTDMLATTLTITNVGPFGVDAAVPILPPGTGAILAVGRIAKAPWVVDDEVVVRHVVEIAMSFDHRQIDGALASAVLRHVGNFLEDPAPALLAG
jgi:pyruvate dehydrogenase E2 component (dihydrolipoamide acetyltransferase)